jgi:hypothetical protein
MKRDEIFGTDGMQKGIIGIETIVKTALGMLRWNLYKP